MFPSRGVFAFASRGDEGNTAGTTTDDVLGPGASYVAKVDDVAGNTTFTHGFNDNASPVAQAVIDIYADDAASIRDCTAVGSQINNGLTLLIEF